MSTRSRQRERERRSSDSASAIDRAGSRPAWRPFLRYALVFGGVTASLQAVTLLPVASTLLRRYAEVNCAAAGGLVNLLGQKAVVHGSILRSSRFVIETQVGCMGIDLLVFCCAVAATYPGPVARKIGGLAVAMAALVVLNLLRIASVFLSGVYVPAAFPTFHEEFWPGVLVLCAVGIMMAWVGWMARGSGRGPLNSRWISFYLRRFALVYGLLLLPWPGLAGLCRGVFCAAGAEAFGGREGPREVSFVAQDAHETRMEIVNRRLMNSDGSGPVRDVDLSAYVLLWRPTSLFLAMVLAAPFSRRVRLVALGVGALGILAMLWLTVDFVLWNESTEVSLHALSSTWKAVTNGVQETLLAVLSLAVPLAVALGALLAAEAFRSGGSAGRPSAGPGFAG
jgi:exosortase/archaeosortase family protein